MLAGDNLDHGGHRWRRAGRGWRRTASGGATVCFSARSRIAEADLAAIASCGYPDVMSDDKVRAAQALGLFISDTVACLNPAVTA
jgi:hypothetical protein